MIDPEALLRGQYAARVEAPGVYRRRRRRVQDALEGGAVALLVGAVDARGYGDVGSFRQDPMFYYLTGVEAPGSVLLLERERDTLFLPARRPNLEAWTGPKIGPGDQAVGLLGFDAVVERDGSEIVVDARRRIVPGWEDRLAGMVAASGWMWAPLPAPSATGGLRPEQQTVARLRDRLPSFRVSDLTPLLVEMRLRKEAGEIALMREAVAATVEAMTAAAQELRPGAREGAIEGAAYAALRRYGAEGWAFPPIVGSGRAACILHYDQNLGAAADGEAVIVDIGARFGAYCADITRTFPASGRFSPRQRRLYDAVLAAYDAAVAELRPGARIADARRAAFAALSASETTAADGRSLGELFIHGVGHFLGMEAHDVGGEEPGLEPGMVVTIEPGVYLPSEGIGIRIEDDYLITADGAENLSVALPRGVDAVEAMSAAGGARKREGL